MSVVLVTRAYDHDTRFWEAVHFLTYYSSERLLAAAIHQKLNIYEINSTSNKPRTMNVTSLCFHDEGRWLVTGSEDGSINTWDLRASQVHRSHLNRSPVNGVCVRPTQGELDKGAGIQQCDLSKNQCSLEWPPIGTPAGDIPIRAVTLASDGSLLEAGNNKARLFHARPAPLFTDCLGRCYVWKPITRCYEFRQQKVLVGHQRWVWDCAFSAHLAYLVTASSDHIAHLWETVSSKTVCQYDGCHEAAVCCALHDAASNRTTPNLSGGGVEHPHADQ
ncbi:WD40-repeat-containing domain protein [Schizophyllum fasciatum]